MNLGAPAVLSVERTTHHLPIVQNPCFPQRTRLSRQVTRSVPGKSVALGGTRKRSARIPSTSVTPDV